MRNRYLLHQAIAHAAEHRPDHPALVFGRESLTYGQLFERANRLARLLREQGVGRGDRVGIYLNKSLESALAIYGILSAGAAYVPLDPLAPPARISFVIQDCGIRHLISADGQIEALRQVTQAVPGLAAVIGPTAPDDLPVRVFSWADVATLPGEPMDVAAVEQDLAYILYTSGSTGVPKGIMHTHRSGLSFAEWAAQAYGLVPSDRLSNHAPLHFDLSTFDYFAGGIAGATTVVISEAATKLPASLARLMAAERISVWYSVPFALIQLLQRGNLTAHNLSALRWVLFAGEPFPTKHLRALMAQLPHARFSNLYGPTETNVCTYYHVPAQLPEADEPIPIGRPCANVEDLVVDADGQPVASGEAGELLIRGGVVMAGYWGQPDKTQRGFFRRAARGYQEDTFYRTGDLVQRLPGGDYKYLGRKDRQIKTRGYRVELDEIEVTLLAHACVEEAAVYPVPDGQGSNLIAAAVVPKAGFDVQPAELVAYLASRLPSYAVPAHLSVTADFPRTSTGKIDRRTLQAQSAASAG